MNRTNTIYGQTSNTNGQDTIGSSETMVLRATPSIKKYNIARFDVPTLPNFKNWKQPVVMYREPERLIDEEDEATEEVVGWNPALRKRRRRRRKDTRTRGWIIEEKNNDKKDKGKFESTYEGGQSSTYMLFVKNRHNNEFSVIPVEQWFRFKKPLSYKTLTLEEAEEMNNEKKRAVERWLMRHRLAGDEKESQPSDIVSAPRVRTGAIGGSTASSSRKNSSEPTDIFSVSEAANRRIRASRSKATAESGPTGDDGGDFEEKFDDDESGAEMQQDDVGGIDSESDDDEFEVENGTGQLTETGQAMKDLLRRAQSGEIDSSHGNGTEMKEEEEVESDAEEYGADDMVKVYKRDLGGNIIQEAGEAGQKAMYDDAKLKASESGDVSNIDDKNITNGSNVAGVNGSNNKNGGKSSVNGKRKADAMENGSSKSKEDMLLSPPAKQPKLTEAGVQQELIRYGGRMRTRDFLRKMKKQIVTDDDRALLKDILRTICDVEVDAIDGRLLVLKSQFR